MQETENLKNESEQLEQFDYVSRESPFPTTPTQGKNFRLVTIFIVTLVSIVVFLGLVWYGKAQRGVSTDKLVSSPVPTTYPEDVPTSETTNAHLEPVLFVRNWSLWEVNEGAEKQISLPAEAVQSYAFNGHYIAYVWGDKQVNSADYEYVYPRVLVLVDTRTGEREQVIKIENVVGQNAEYLYQLQDVAFSRDGRTLAFTTSNNVYLYAINSRTSKPVFTEIGSAQSKSNEQIPIFGYHHLSFSPTDEYLYMNRGFYEGVEPVVIRTDTLQEVSVPKAAEMNGYSGRVIDWLDDVSLLGTQDGYSEAPEGLVELVRMDVQSQTVNTFGSTFAEESVIGVFPGGSIQLFTLKNVQDESGAQATELAQLVSDEQSPNRVRSIKPVRILGGVQFNQLHYGAEGRLWFGVTQQSGRQHDVYVYDLSTGQVAIAFEDAVLDER